MSPGTGTDSIAGLSGMYKSRRPQTSSLRGWSFTTIVDGARLVSVRMFMAGLEYRSLCARHNREIQRHAFGVRPAKTRQCSSKVQSEDDDNLYRLMMIFMIGRNR